MNEFQDFSHLFERYLGKKVQRTDRIGGGRNSQVYQIVLDEGMIYAAKIYFRSPTDKRDRLQTEFTGLQFLWNHGIQTIPQPIFCAREKNMAVYEYIEGPVANLNLIDVSDIDQAVNFLISLDRIKLSKGSEILPPASEACFSVKEMIAIVESRYSRLMSIPSEGIMVAEMLKFLKKDLGEFLIFIKQWVKDILEKAECPYDRELSDEERTLSPSDFGYHNAIRRNDGQLVFLDFEYFGWDDPVKMIVDFLLHPGMNITDKLKQRYLDRLRNHFEQSQGERAGILRTRLMVGYPLFGLKWCLILLNEFVPADLERRNFAATDKTALEERRINQLEKSRAKLTEVRWYYERHLQIA